MNKDTETLYCSIKTDLMRRTLFKGSFLAGMGALIILIGGVFLNEETLKSWGLPLFFFSMGLIALGMIPYRRLTQLEKSPHRLVIDEGELIFLKQGKKTLTIPKDAIEKTTYIENGNFYGIGLSIKPHPDKKVIVHTRRFDYDRQQQYTKKRFGCDLFLPYFSKRSYQKLLEFNH